MYIANSLENLFLEPLARMLFKLAWSILGTKRFKFVQIKSLGLQMSPPQKGDKNGKFKKILFWTSRPNAKIFGM